MTTISNLPRADERAYPLLRHIGLLAPLVIVVFILVLLPGSEKEVIRQLKEHATLSPIIHYIMEILTDLGNVPFYIYYAVLLALSFFRGRKNDWSYVISYLIALLLLLLTVDLIKVCVGRPRPELMDESMVFSTLHTFTLHDAYHSFPSSHEAETVLTAGLVALHSRSRAVFAYCGCWIAMMGVTRMYLGRHFPSDLLGGALVASAFVWLAWQLAACHYGQAWQNVVRDIIAGKNPLPRIKCILTQTKHITPPQTDDRQD